MVFLVQDDIKLQCHYQEIYSIRYLVSIFTKRPSRFGWLIKDKLAGSGRMITNSQLAWVTNNGIKSVFTIREYPLPQSWFSPGFGIDYKHLKVENGAPPVDELDDAVDYIEDDIKKTAKLY